MSARPEVPPDSPGAPRSRRHAGTAVAVVAVLSYVALWVGYRSAWGWLDGLDAALLGASHRFGTAHPGWVSFWNGVCTVFAPVTFRVVAAAVIVAALLARRLRPALFLVVCVEPTEYLTRLAKHLADRPRPTTALVSASSTSFPSGHALGVMIGVAGLLAVLLPLLSGRPRSLTVLAVAVGVVLVLAVGSGRVILNVHYPSDVLAGWALGYAYFQGCRRVVPRAGWPGPAGGDRTRPANRPANSEGLTEGSRLDLNSRR